MQVVATYNCQIDDATCCTLPLRCTARGTMPWQHSKWSLMPIRNNMYGKKTCKMQLSPATEDALGRGNMYVRLVPFPAVTYQTQANCHLERPVGLIFTKKITHRIAKKTNMFTRLSSKSSFKRSEDSAPPSVCVHSPRHTRSPTGRGQ